MTPSHIITHYRCIVLQNIVEADGNLKHWKLFFLDNWVKIATPGNAVNFEPHDLCTKRPIDYFLFLGDTGQC